MRGRAVTGVRPCLVLCLFLASVAHAVRSEVRGDQFYVDGVPFYVKAVGYAPWRPHQRPGISYAGTNRRWTRMDFERIKAANFNTIRTWDDLEPEELALAREYGLMVLQGIWLDPKQDFSDPHNQQSAAALVQRVVERSKDYDHILGYVLMTEPSPQAVLESGEAETLEFFRKLKRTIQAADPRPVSMDSWPPLAFLDHRDFDFVMINLFAFWPPAISRAMGLAGMTRWSADHLADGRPLLVGETGGYSVSKTSRTAAGGFGGLSEYSQSLKNIDSLRATLEGHAAGSVLVSWIDTWHYPRDPDTHDDEPWEWNGILAIPTDSDKDMQGVPRQLYRDVTAYNQLIPLEPKANHFYPVLEPQSIRVSAAPGVAWVRYRLNQGDWKELDGAGRGWFQGSFTLPKLARKRQTISFQALDNTETVLATKDVAFVAHGEPEQITIHPSGAAQARAFRIELRTADKMPIAGRKVDVACWDPVRFGEYQGTVTTDAQGIAILSCPMLTPAPEAYLFVAAGADSPVNTRAAALRIIKLGPK